MSSDLIVLNVQSFEHLKKSWKAVMYFIVSYLGGQKDLLSWKSIQPRKLWLVICFLSLNYSLSLILIIQKESLFLFLRTWLYYFWAKTVTFAFAYWHFCDGFLALRASRVPNISFLIFSSLTFDIHFVETHLIEDKVSSRPSVLSIASGCHLWPYAFFFSNDDFQLCAFRSN